MPLSNPADQRRVVNGNGARGNERDVGGGVGAVSARKSSD